jgi:hypothetical protein
MDEMSSARLFEAANARTKKAEAMIDEIFSREYYGKSYDNRSLEDFYTELKSDTTSVCDLDDMQNTLQLYDQRIFAGANSSKSYLDTHAETDENFKHVKKMYETECKFMETYRIMANKIDVIRQEKLAQQNIVASVGSMKI